MNYITEIKAFYDLQTIKPLSTGQIALWYALMHINNKCAWVQWFSVSNSTLQFFTGLSRKSIYNARNVLRQLGYIEFKEVGNGKASKYLLKTLSKFTQDTTQIATQDTTQITTQDTTQITTPLNKLNETKLNETNTGGKPRRIKFVKPALEDVKAYCRERNNGVNAEQWLDHYSSNGWKVGKSPMSDWKSAVRTWEHNDYNKKTIAQEPKRESFDEMMSKVLEDMI